MEQDLKDLLSLRLSRYRWLVMRKLDGRIMVQCARDENGLGFHVKLEIPERDLVQAGGVSPSDVLLSYANEMTQALETHIKAKTQPSGDPVLDMHRGSD